MARGHRSRATRRKTGSFAPPPLGAGPARDSLGWVSPTRIEIQLMKAAVYYETGGPEVFRYEDVPDPVAGPGEVLVQVEAISIEGGDTLSRLGGDMSRSPHIVGYQCAGTVVTTGEGV